MREDESERTREPDRWDSCSFAIDAKILSFSQRPKAREHGFGTLSYILISMPRCLQQSLPRNRDRGMTIPRKNFHGECTHVES